MRANFVKTVAVIDPDSQGEVQIAVFKHQNGGMFAMDESYLDQCFEDDNGIIIPDPFESEFCELELMGL